MLFSDINLHPDRRTLRQFAALWIIFFGAIAAWKSSLVVAAVAAAGGALGLAFPTAIRPVFVGWMILAFPIGWLISHVVLALVYFVVFLPIGLWFRVIGRDALALRKPDRDTYWSEKPAQEDVSRYFRQF
ncbi:MAG: SxtJ family membrane protein [Bryobacteraceae bacterium]